MLAIHRVGLQADVRERASRSTRHDGEHLGTVCFVGLEAGDFVGERDDRAGGGGRDERRPDGRRSAQAERQLLERGVVVHVLVPDARAEGPYGQASQDAQWLA